MIHRLWNLLEPPAPAQPPIYERHHGLRCGACGVADSWVDLTHLGRVLRAREAANATAEAAGLHPPYVHEAPDSDRWCKWQRPGAPASEPVVIERPRRRLGVA